MFDITSSKLLILGIVALLVIGPKDLPALLRTIGKYMGMIKRQAAEFRAQFDETLIPGIQIRNPEVQDRAGMIELRRFRRAQHQPHSSAVKESQIRHGEKQRQAQYITVECRGALQVFDNNGNLADVQDSECGGRAAHWCLPPGAD